MAYSKFCSKRYLPITGGPTNVSSFYFLHLFRSKFRPSVAFASVDSSPTAFGLHVCHVVGVGTKEKVIDTDASRVIALVTYAESIWNLAMVESPRKSMGEPMFAVVSKDSVAVFLRRSLPLNAITNVCGLLVESFRRRFARHKLG